MIILRISAPFASFKHSYSREYADSFPAPPPATIYGCLLSLVGETKKNHHLGVKIALGLPFFPKQSTVLRTFRKFKEKDINHPKNSIPDFQTVLCQIEVVVCIDSSEDPHNLELRVQEALTHPETLERFGGLSLGESRDLIDNIELLDSQPPELNWLVKDVKGRIKFPYWVDYLGSKDTQWQKFSWGEFCSEAFCQIQNQGK